MKLAWLSLLIAAILSLAATSIASPTFELGWTHSTDPTATYYNIYVWTNTPDFLCTPASAIVVTNVGYVTNATVIVPVAIYYTFAATTVDTNQPSGYQESYFSNFAYWNWARVPGAAFQGTIQVIRLGD